MCLLLLWVIPLTKPNGNAHTVLDHIQNIICNIEHTSPARIYFAEKSHYCYDETREV